MVIEIDFNSDEAIYVQLMNQIILGIATSRLQEGDPLPSVRQLADTIGINMHTVNKAYSLLTFLQQPFASATIRFSFISSMALILFSSTAIIAPRLRSIVTNPSCLSREEVHGLIDEIYDEYGID